MGGEGTGRHRLGQCAAQQAFHDAAGWAGRQADGQHSPSCNGWAETQAAYRFLAQEDISWEDILAPHFSCTQERMQGRPVALCIRDTTELNFNGQQTEGLGTLSFAA